MLAREFNTTAPSRRVYGSYLVTIGRKEHMDLPVVTLGFIRFGRAVAGGASLRCGGDFHSRPW